MAALNEREAPGVIAVAERQAGRTSPRKPPGAFGQLLRELRGIHGLSQAAVARGAQVSSGYIGLIEVGERGDRPSLEIVRRIAQALDATVPETEGLLRAAGHLGPDETLVPADRPSFAAFVNADLRLSREQKAVLKMQYEIWLGHGAATLEGR